MYIGVHILFKLVFSFSLDKYLELMNLVLFLFWILWRISIQLSKVAASTHLNFHQQYMRISLSVHPCQHMFSSVQWLSRVQLFAIPWTAACQASLSITNSQSLLKLMSIDDAIQTYHSLSSPSPPTFNLSLHQGLFNWVSSLHQVAKVLEFQLQHQSFQWILRADFL